MFLVLSIYSGLNVCLLAGVCFPGRNNCTGLVALPGFVSANNLSNLGTTGSFYRSHHQICLKTPLLEIYSQLLKWADKALRN